MTRPAPRDAFIDTAGAIELPLADAIARSLGDDTPQGARVFAASVGAAVRIALC
ncbi:hypothetical protein FHR81_002066 [Actinoalloteichus hoggarensis]|uniref:Uncharacterized protein n=1 Tax=Actinoalloteichus hoggarensis TaxID=1470176 RepID=A0A221W5I0_9PSEU|nr:hypothetical protein AHOG_17365 [Actinoalloteichus hoggarensis]MBB5921028.1 hypothetical protein [Actinoalloteichus hoggarensis]